MTTVKLQIKEKKIIKWSKNMYFKEDGDFTNFMLENLLEICLKSDIIR